MLALLSMVALLTTMCCMLLAAVACIGLGEGAYRLQVHLRQLLILFALGEQVSRHSQSKLRHFLSLQCARSRCEPGRLP